MGYSTMAACVADLEKKGHLIRIKEEVDPHLQMASIHLRVFEAGGPALYFENVKGSKFPAVSNLFGSLERSRFIFRDRLELVKHLVRLKIARAFSSGGEGEGWVFTIRKQALI